jgi:hypothetical protein
VSDGMHKNPRLRQSDDTFYQFAAMPLLHVARFCTLPTSTRETRKVRQSPGIVRNRPACFQLCVLAKVKSRALKANGDPGVERSCGDPSPAASSLAPGRSPY